MRRYGRFGLCEAFEVTAPRIDAHLTERFNNLAWFIRLLHQLGGFIV